MKRVNLVLGTMTFGESVFPPDAGKFIEAFFDAGYSELDTAYVYNEGSCERILGDVLANTRRQFIIDTKVNPRISGKLDGEAAYKQLNESLERLRLDRVDTVYLHFPDPATPVISVLEAMADMHARGKFTELGLSNFPAWMVADVWHICDKHGWVKPTVFEGVYNPLTRGAEKELNACLDSFGMRFYAYNPMCGGLLTGRYGSFEDAPEKGRFVNRPNYRGRYWKRSFFEAVELIKDAAEKYGLTPVESVYRWLSFHSMLRAERGDAVIMGASKLEHLKQNLGAVKAGPLPEELAAVFEQAWEAARGDSPDYFTLYRGKGSVGGEKQ